MIHEVEIRGVVIGNPSLTLIAGPCVIESVEMTYDIASALKKITSDLEIHFIFKASYDKANRTSACSFRGPGKKEGLKILKAIGEALDVPILSDVHSVEEVQHASDVLDVIQIPAFLCRQTDLVQAVAETGKPVNVKKGQFISPKEMRFVVEKITEMGNNQIILTERGTTFGYNNLIVDFRSFAIMREFGYPIIFDVTHSVQLPGVGEGFSGGSRQHIPLLARAAVAAGVDGIFMEVHPNPDQALCDGANSFELKAVPTLLKRLLKIREGLEDPNWP